MSPKTSKLAKSAKEDKNKKKPIKKKPIKKRASPKKPSDKKKTLAKTVTVDVINDEKEEPSNLVKKEEAVSNQVDIEKIDSQKKYFSELVSEIKAKQKKIKAEEKSPKAKSLKMYRRLAFRFLALVAVFLLIIAYFTVTKLTVIIVPAAERISDSVQFEVVSSTEAATSLPAARVVPGEIIENLISTEKVYSTSGEEKIGEEVVGQVVIYNEYSRSQPLVATTRLLSPEQKLFRIKEGVTVPAGGSVKVDAYADIVSPEMAIEPTRLTIPGLWLGLQDQIYAINEEGFEYKSKIRNFVRQADLDLAINDIRHVLKNKLEQEINWQMRPGDAIAYEIDSASSLLTIEAKLGEEREDFLAKAENQAIIVRFSQQRAEELLQAKLAFSLPEEKELTSFSSEQITYTLNDYNLETGQAVVTASFTGSVRLKENNNFIDQGQLSNLNQGQIEEYLNSFSEIADFELKFFPTFIRRAPHLTDRIEIKIKD